MSQEKFRNLILYVCRKGADDPRLGRTKLNKLLYYIDFGYYLRTGNSVSGEEYMAIQQGPVPRCMLPVLQEMHTAGAVREQLVPAGIDRQTKKQVAVSSPDLSSFSQEEIAFIDEIVDRFEKLTGTDLVNMSHDEPGYKTAEYRGTIPYATVYYPVFVEPTEKEIELTKELAKRHGWYAEYAA